jgi:hypothetical protein
MMVLAFDPGPELAVEGVEVAQVVGREQCQESQADGRLNPACSTRAQPPGRATRGVSIRR